jgi:hypothetical protein
MQFLNRNIHFGKSLELVMLPCMFLKKRKEKNRQNKEVGIARKKMLLQWIGRLIMV